MTILRQPLRPESSNSPTSPVAHVDSSRSIGESAEQLEQMGAIAAARSAWLAAIESDDTPRSRLEFAAFLTRTRNFEEAVGLFEMLLRETRVLTDPHVRGVVRHNLAAVLRQIGQGDLAASLQQMANRDRLLADGELTGHELTATALDAIHRDDLATAQDLLQRAIQVERREGNVRGEAADCGNLAVIAAERNDRSTAVALLLRACSLHRSLGDWYAAGRDLLHLSIHLPEIGRLSLAVRCATRAQQYLATAGAKAESDDAGERRDALQRAVQLRRCNPLLN